MKVTVCEICRKQGGNPGQIDRWAKISFANGRCASYLGLPTQHIELCGDCFNRLTEPPIK